MERETYDQWRTPMSDCNQEKIFYIQCDCGRLAKKIYRKSCYTCDYCGRSYVRLFGDFGDFVLKDRYVYLK